MYYNRHYITLLSSEKIANCYLDYQLVVKASHKLHFDNILQTSCNSNTQRKLYNKKNSASMVLFFVVSITSFWANCTSKMLIFFLFTTWLRTFLLLYGTSYTDYHPASCPFLFSLLKVSKPLLTVTYFNLCIIYSWYSYLLCKSQSFC